MSRKLKFRAVSWWMWGLNEGERMGTHIFLKVVSVRCEYCYLLCKKDALMDTCAYVYPSANANEIKGRRNLPKNSGQWIFGTIDLRNNEIDKKTSQDSWSMWWLYLPWQCPFQVFIFQFFQSHQSSLPLTATTSLSRFTCYENDKALFMLAVLYSRVDSFFIFSSCCGFFVRGQPTQVPLLLHLWSTKKRQSREEVSIRRPFSDIAWNARREDSIENYQLRLAKE